MTKKTFKESINKADELAEKGMFKEALEKHQRALRAISRRKNAEAFGHIKNHIGYCYAKLAAVSKLSSRRLRGRQRQFLKETLKFRKISRFQYD